MSESMEKLLYIACNNGDYSLVQTYIHRGVNVNGLIKIGYTDWTPLERATHHGYTNIVKLLLQHGADVNQRDTDGETALMVSSVQGHVETANVLLENSARVDLKNNNGWCALMWASREGHVESTRVLLDHGAPVDLQNSSGDSSLIVACRWGAVETTKMLLQHGANVNLQNGKGSSALMCAITPEISKQLLENSALVNLQNNNGETALMWACINECKATVETLLEHGADVNLESKERKTALTLARSNEVLELLRNTNASKLVDKSVAKAVEQLTDPRHGTSDYSHLDAVANAMKERGTLEHTLVHGLFAGPAGSGKSSLMSRLIGEMPNVESPSTGVATSVVQVKVKKSTSIACTVSVGCESPSSWLKLLYSEEAIGTINFAFLASLSPTELKITADSAHIQPTLPAINTLPISSASLPSLQSGNASAPLPFDNSSPSTVPPKGYVAPMSLFRSSLCHEHLEKLRQHFQSSWSLYLTDTGGQIEFQEILPLLVSGSSLFFITFRLDRDLNQRYTIEYRLPDGHRSESYQSTLTVKEMILQTLASVASMETTTDSCTQLKKSVELKPKVFIVGTHKDKLNVATCESKINKIDEYLQKIIKSTAHYREDLVEYASEFRLIYAVNNLSGDDSDFEEIRLGVEKVVQRDEYKMAFPSHWLIFGLVLRQQTIKDRIITYEECFTIARDCGINDRSELNKALQFLHKMIGLVCHFDTPCLTDVVIRDPQVIFDHVTQLIVQSFSFSCVGKRRCEEFKKKGIFCFEDLSKSMQFHSHMSAEKLVELLKHLQIVAPFQTENGKTKYFLPCVLAHSEMCENEPVSPSANQIPPLLITFKCGYCPKGLAGALIVHLLTHEPKSKFKWSLKTDQIFRDQVSFLVSPWDTITLCVHPTFLMLIHLRELSASSQASNVKDICNCACKFVEEGILNIVSSMKLTSDARHSLSFYCQNDMCTKSSGVHPASEIMRNPEGEPCSLKCNTSGKTFISLPPEGCLTWFGKECQLDLLNLDNVNEANTPDSEQPLYTECDKKAVIKRHKPKSNASIDIEQLNPKVKLILLTCNENEKWAVYEKLQPPFLDTSKSQSLQGALYIPQNDTVIGTFAGYTVAVLTTEKGKKCEKDLKNALDTFTNAQAIIGVGVAYGKDRETIELGDVMISDHIEDASQVSAVQKSSNGQITIAQRGGRIPIKNELLRYFKSNTMEWHHNNAVQVSTGERISQAKVGTIVSCETLMRSRDLRDQYMDLMAQTVGGEMVGCSLLNMIDWMEQERRPLGVIIIKGVADYGDNQDNKRWQFTAAKAAVDFIHYCLEKTGGMAEFNAGPGTNKRQTRGPDSNPHYWKLVAVVATILFAVIIGLYCSQYNI